NPASAVWEWVRAFGEPVPSGLPRSTREERAVCREAYTRTLWRPEAPGWLSAAGDPGAPKLYPFDILALQLDAGFGAAAAAAHAEREQADQALQALRKQGPLPTILAYRAGGVPASLEAERARLEEDIRSQLASGA